MIDWLRGKVLRLADEGARKLSPYKPFTREAVIADPRSLKEKAAHYEADIRKRWLYGKECEFYWSMKPNDGGDMAIWHGVYAATVAMRGDKRDIGRALIGMELLQTLGGNNRLARGADKIGGQLLYDPTKTRWEDRGYWYHADVSESTLIGHLYGLWGILRFDDDNERKARAKALAKGLADQIIADGYRLLDQDGNPARFGDLRPDTLKTVPIRQAALLCSLLLAYVSTGDPKYQRIYRLVAKKNAYSITRLETKFGPIDPAYDDVLAYFCLLILMTTDGENPDLLALYRQGLDNQWAKNKEEGNSFYTFAHWYLTKATERRYLDNAVKRLAEFNTDPRPDFPCGKRGVERINSNDPDIDKRWVWFWRWRKHVATQPLPAWKQPASDFIWQRNPYDLDGWIGHKEPNPEKVFNGLDFCAAYELGRKGALL